MRQILYGVSLANLFSLICSLSFATVGGAESIHIMGYDKKDQKIYLNRQYHDQSGRVPQLYYYQLSSKQPDKLIEVKSIYKDKDRNSPRTEQYVAQQLKNIQSRLIPLQQQNPKKVTLKLLQQNRSTGEYWQTTHPDGAFQVKKFEQTYQLCQHHYQSNIHKSISYLKPEINISQYWQVSQHSVRIAVVSYLGLNIESGYPKEDPIFLTAQSPRSKC